MLKHLGLFVVEMMPFLSLWINNYLWPLALLAQQISILGCHDPVHLERMAPHQFPVADVMKLLPLLLWGDTLLKFHYCLQADHNKINECHTWARMGVTCTPHVIHHAIITIIIIILVWFSYIGHHGHPICCWQISLHALLNHAEDCVSDRVSSCKQLILKRKQTPWLCKKMKFVSRFLELHLGKTYENMHYV